MNREELADAWKKGNEETLGWVYQAFNSEELQAAFAGAREQKKKFTPEDIPAVTQLFTIRWVVRFLVENSLGKLWLDIHPDSSLKDKLVYLVSPDSNVTNRLKLAKDISFLDPACGSMHFGLVAFDLFYEMYKEELEKNGQEGWPDIPSVNGEEYIPGAIIENNLHGMDIDLRAVQLSALALFLKARGKNPKCYFNDSKLLCANIEAVTGGCLEKFIESAKLQNPVYERILIKLAQRLKDSENMGSLLRLEEELKKLIFEERSKAKVVSQKTLGLDEVEEDLFENSATMVKFFDTLEESIQKKLDDFIRETGKRNSLSMRFAHETSKGLCFLKLISKQYDVVATNPPYLSNRKMNKRLAELLEESYPEGKQDLYAAFIKRCSQLLSPSGLMGMLTMHSFMFISSYALLRQKLIESVNVEVMAHFGGGLFSVGNPATLQTTAFVLRKEANDKTRKEREGIFFRLVKGKNAEE
ncbi:MAG: SAM-dependent DNA methyltransferase, partial [Clostridia bacterium]|nr:SAM-dependent DNA methyltransferase [Clostridia bacterium]